MAKLKTTVLPLATYPIGTLNLGPVSVAAGATSILLELDGASMTDPALHVAMTIDISLDGGATWNNPHPAADPFPVGMTLNGGVLNRQGLPLAIYSLGCGLPDPANNQRRIRAIVVITGTPLTTQGSVTVE